MDRRGSQKSVPRLVLISFYLGSQLISRCWGLSWKCPHLVEEGTEGLVMLCPRIDLLALGQGLLGVFLSPLLPGAGFYSGIFDMMRSGWREPAGAACCSHTPTEPLSPHNSHLTSQPRSLLTTLLFPSQGIKSPHSYPLSPHGPIFLSRPHSSSLPSQPHLCHLPSQSCQDWAFTPSPGTRYKYRKYWSKRVWRGKKEKKQKWNLEISSALCHRGRGLGLDGLYINNLCFHRCLWVTQELLMSLIQENFLNACYKK